MGKCFSHSWHLLVSTAFRDAAKAAPARLQIEASAQSRLE